MANTTLSLFHSVLTQTVFPKVYFFTQPASIGDYFVLHNQRPGHRSDPDTTNGLMEVLRKARKNETRWGEASGFDRTASQITTPEAGAWKLIESY